MFYFPLNFGTRGRRGEQTVSGFLSRLLPCAPPMFCRARTLRSSGCCLVCLLSRAGIRATRSPRTDVSARAPGDRHTKSFPTFFTTGPSCQRTFASRISNGDSAVRSMWSNQCLWSASKFFAIVIYRFNWTLLFRSIKKRVSRRSRAHRNERAVYGRFLGLASAGESTPLLSS